MLCIAIIPNRMVALMITDSQTQVGKIMMKEIKKKEEKLDISISNRKIELLNFLRFVSFTVLVTFKNSVIIP